MSKNGKVIFFIDDLYGIWLTDQYETGQGWRGYSPDGCFWVDYNIDTKTVHICVASAGVVNWDNPVNSYNKSIDEEIEVTIPIDNVHPLEVKKWAQGVRSVKN